MISTVKGHSPFKVDNIKQDLRFEIGRQFRRARGHRATKKNRLNPCRGRDPKCYFDFIPKRSNNNSMDNNFQHKLIGNKENLQHSSLSRPLSTSSSTSSSAYFSTSLSTSLSTSSSMSSLTPLSRPLSRPFSRPSSLHLDRIFANGEILNVISI